MDHIPDLPIFACASIHLLLCLVASSFLKLLTLLQISLGQVQICRAQVLSVILVLVAITLMSCKEIAQ